MRRRSATWTACCRPRTSRAPMPSSSVGRPRRTYPSRVCQEGRAPAVRLRGGLSGAAPGHRGLCAAGHARIRVVHEPRCRGLRHAGQLRRVRAGLRQRGARAAGARLSGPGGRRASIHAWPLCRRLSRRPCFTREAIAYLLACAGNIQHLRHRKTYAERIANADSLGWLLEARRRVAGDAPSSIAALRANLGRARRRGGIPGRAPCDLGRAGGQGSRRPGDPQAPERCAPGTEIFADEPGR